MTTFIILTVALALVVLIMREYGWTDLTGNTRNDLVFEQRNKSYGAYEIRQSYGNRLIIAFFGMLGIMTMAAFGPRYLMTSQKEIVKNEKNNEGGFIIEDIDIPKEEKKKEEIFEDKTQDQQQQQQKNDISTTASTAPVASTKPLEKDTTEIKNAVVATTNHLGTDSLSNGSNVLATTGTTGTGTGTGNNDGNSGGILGDIDVDERAEFPGGIKPYLAKHTRYPEDAISQGKTGKVYVEFIVNEDGTTKVMGIKKSVCESLDAEAKRVIANMKGWKPAKFNQKYVKVRMVQPISFILE